MSNSIFFEPGRLRQAREVALLNKKEVAEARARDAYVVTLVRENEDMQMQMLLQRRRNDDALRGKWESEETWTPPTSTHDFGEAVSGFPLSSFPAAELAAETIPTTTEETP